MLKHTKVLMHCSQRVALHRWQVFLSIFLSNRTVGIHLLKCSKSVVAWFECRVGCLCVVPLYCESREKQSSRHQILLVMWEVCADSNGVSANEMYYLFLKWMKYNAFRNIKDTFMDIPHNCFDSRITMHM
jgi:hypothetical protein